MNADTFFVTGKLHPVCQDYAAAGQTAQQTYAIVSDGCSSSPDTDFGSRLLTRAAIHILRLYHNIDPVSLIETAAHMAAPLRLHEQALDATLLIAYSTEHEVVAQAWGDGVIVARRRDGLLQIYQIEFPSGAPLYLNYWQNAPRLDAYLAKFGADRKVRMTANDHETTWGHSAVGEHHGTRFDSSTPFEPVGFTLRFDRNDYDMVAVLTDGVQAFRKRVRHDFEPINALEIIEGLTAFKGNQGQFVARRAKAFFKQAGKDDWHWADDVSIAAIHLGDVP